MVDPVTPNRDQLRRVIGQDERFLIALERLFQVGGTETPNNLLALQQRISAREQLSTRPDDASILETGRDVLRGLSSQFFVFVSDKYDLPMASAGVITLEDNISYCIITDIDLEGDRLEIGQNNALIGTSSENASITSTGLTGTAMISGNYSLDVRDITLTADVLFDLDATGIADQNIFFTGVSVVDTDDIGTIAGYGNFIARSGGFRNSSGLVLDSILGTVALTEYLFDSQSTGTVLTIPASGEILRRFRIIYSSFVIASGATGLDVSASATIPVEGYILDTNNFTGAGTYITGLTGSDNEALFVNNIGINNSANVSNYYMTGNATATVIVTQGVPVKIAGTTTSSSITQRFTNTDNRATYTGAVNRTFKVDAIASVGGASSRTFSVYVAVNGSVVTSSKSTGKTNSGGDPDQVISSLIISLNENDYVEAWVANEDNTTNLTVVDLNVLVGII